MKKKKIDSLPKEIQELNLSDNIKKYILDAGFTSIEELKKLRYGDFPDWPKIRVKMILNEVDPKVSFYRHYEDSEKLQDLKKKYLEEIDSRNIDKIRIEILNIPILELNINIGTVLELKKNNINTLKELLECMYNEDGTINYIQLQSNKKIIELADYFNLPIKNDPRITLMYYQEKALDYSIEVLNLTIMGIENVLKENNIQTIGNLLYMTKDELSLMLGIRRADVVINRVHSYGVKFFDEQKSYVDKDSKEIIYGSKQL